jgi:hypothetical protein
MNPTNANGHNVLPWTIPSNTPFIVSENAKLGITPQGVGTPTEMKQTGSFGDDSDNSFTIAGIAITYPTAGSSVRMGSVVNIRWVAAGAGTNGVSVDLFNGVQWTNLSTSVQCVPGTNAVNMTVDAEDPTETAYIRIRSNDDPVNVWGLSPAFALADINIVAPFGGPEAVRDQWQIGQTNYVEWTSAGVSNTVTIDYSPDGGGAWINIVANYANTNSGGGTL